MVFAEEINEISENFPNKELYNLSSQIRRAADSIALNIAEGSIGQSKAEFQKFVGYSIRSREYLTNGKFQQLYDDSFCLMNMMIAFKKHLK